MCQGLPCVGHRVRLKRTIIREGRNLFQYDEGIVKSEDVGTRKVLVYFDSRGRAYWISENDLEAVY